MWGGADREARAGLPAGRLAGADDARPHPGPRAIAATGRGGPVSPAAARSRVGSGAAGNARPDDLRIRPGAIFPQSASAATVLETRWGCDRFLRVGRRSLLCHPERQRRACPELSRRDLAVCANGTAGFFASRCALAQNDNDGRPDSAVTPLAGVACLLQTWHDRLASCRLAVAPSRVVSRRRGSVDARASSRLTANMPAHRGCGPRRGDAGVGGLQ